MPETVEQEKISIPVKKENSFFQKRMDQIGFDPEVHNVTYIQKPGEFGGSINQPLFFPDKHGNICIPYFDLEGICYTKDDNSTSITRHKLFYRYRLENPIQDRKYLPNIKGMGVRPYLTIPLIKAFTEKKKIKTLIIVEGEFKAFVGGENGLYILSIPGITIWKKKGAHSIFPEIEALIKECDIKEIIFLIDADLFDVEWSEGKDLHKRPFNFFTSVKNFKLLCVDFGIDMYLAHIKTDLKEKALDDLIISYPKKKKKIVKELLQSSGKFEYFTKYYLNDWTISKIRRLFNIESPEDFYQEYQNVIGLHPFIYRWGQYQYDEDAKELVCKKSRESSQFLMIQNTIYMTAHKPTIHGENQSVLLPIREKTMQIKLKDKNLFKRVLREMDFYVGSYNLPSHTDYKYSKTTTDYNGNTSEWYNMYRPLTWRPMQGDFTNTMKLVKHIFGERIIKWTNKESDTEIAFPSYELGLDYIQMLWENPTHILPILCLVSDQRETGKTAFWDWMRTIFQQNAKKITASELGKQFTSYFATSLLVVMEETHIDKKSLVEVLKEMSTAKDGKLEGKFKDASDINQFIKLGMSSNNVNNFALIDEGENRFWVREIPSIKKEDKVQNYDQKLIEEIPHFLDFIQKRKMVTVNESRSHFNPELIMTDALKRVQKGSRTGLEKTTDDYLKNEFSITKETILSFSIPDLQERVDGTKDKNYYRHILNEKWKMQPSKHSKTYKLYSGHFDVKGEYTLSADKKKSICYTFYASDFLDKETLFTTYNINQLVELEEKIIKQNRKTFFKKIKIDYVWELHLDLKKYLESGENKIEKVSDMISEYGTLKEWWEAICKLINLKI